MRKGADSAATLFTLQIGHEAEKRSFFVGRGKLIKKTNKQNEQLSFFDGVIDLGREN